MIDEIILKDVPYVQNGISFKGFLAHDTQTTERRPAVIIAHEWWGLNDFAKAKVVSLAALGYVAFAVDLYGNGRTTSDAQEAAAMAREVRGTPLMRERIVAGYSILKKMNIVDSESIGAIGFCFGGTAVLELAYSGAGLKSAVIFHGGLIVPSRDDIRRIRSHFLILHGADDPSNLPETITAFQNGLREAGVDWQMVYYGNAVHSFTNPANGTDNKRGVAYNAAAANRSWRLMQSFFEETLCLNEFRGEHYEG
jgi:dienelactone hydrolase